MDEKGVQSTGVSKEESRDEWDFRGVVGVQDKIFWQWEGQTVRLQPTEFHVCGDKPEHKNCTCDFKRVGQVLVIKWILYQVGW